MNTKPIVVIGDGWAALGAAGFLASNGIEVKWVAGTGTRILAPLACLEWGPGVEVLEELASKLGIDAGEPRQGVYLREFRNRAFREPAWAKAETANDRCEARNETLWAPECRFVGATDARFALPLSEIETEIRAHLVPENFPNLQRIENIPVTGFGKNGQQVVSVQLASGVEIECDQVIYADRWGVLPGLSGMPKALSFLRKRDPMGILQANFLHRVPVGVGVMESFLSVLPKESGEKLERRVWGYFSSDGRRSTWTLCLTHEEGENNHEIAKKFRRLKSVLDRIFLENGFLPAHQESFSATVLEENVRLAESVIFAEGKSMTAPEESSLVSGISFLTDGYGPSFAFQQVGSALGIDSHSFDSQAESVDAFSPNTL